MVFTEFRFFYFFVTVFAVYWLLRHHLARKCWLLICSYAFYAAWDWRFLSLIWLSTIVDYLVGLALGKTNRPASRRSLLCFSLLTNLGLLGFFKYFGFFVDSAQQLSVWLGLPFETQTLRILLPVGISFYTFQTLSYTIDVFRRQLQPTRNLVDFALFVAFFPQLVAGPIVRARTFLPQLQRRKRWNWRRLQLGVEFLIMGLVKKLIIADRMAMIVDPVFANPGDYGTGALWMAAVAFVFQMYGDFSGYSDMATGTAHMLGYKLAKNFHIPFLAANIGEFWRRWHMSLSSWMRDYVYLPLGGGRCSRWRGDCNMLLMMTLCGLWHGAAWTFVIWGMLQGFLLIGHRRFRDLCARWPAAGHAFRSALGTRLCVVLTFLAVFITAVFFRADTLERGWLMLQRMFYVSKGFGSPLNDWNLWCTILLIAFGHAAGAAQMWPKVSGRIPSPLLGMGYAAAVVLALALSPELGRAFVYFQF